MTCMNFYPRSATVRAESDVVAYEMLRNVLDIMLKNKRFAHGWTRTTANVRWRIICAACRCSRIFPATSSNI